MPTATIKGWRDTGTGRQKPVDLSVEVAGDTIAGAASGAKRFVASAALVANDLVYVDGWNVANELPTMGKADADASGKHAQFVIRDTIASGAIGVAYTTHESAATLNTDGASAAGDPVYLSTTAGGWTVTAPTGASAVVQIVGRVQVKSATVGVVQFDLGDQPTVGTNDIQDGAVLNAQIGAAAAIDRSKLAEDALKLSLSLPVNALLQTTGIPLSASETAGNMNVSVSSDVLVAQGEITDNETEVSICYAQVTLPPEYVSAGDVTVRVPCAIVKTGAAVDNGSTVDVAVFKQAAGAVGADLSTTTAAATFAAVDTWYNKDFVITAAGLAAGDVLNVKITSSIIDSEVGAGTLRFNMQAPLLLLDIKG